MFPRRIPIIAALSLLIVSMVMMNVPINAQSDPLASLVNLDHLKFLTEPVTIDGREMAIVHIYSEAPDYKWVDAAGEGISAIDDVARAAIVFLHDYERTKSAESLDLARRCLEFVRYMQTPDGEFYNFVFNRDGKINETGGTSYKSLTWWAMRGLWALGEGVRVFDSADKAYADELAKSFQLTEAALAKTMTRYGEFTEKHGYKIPAWLPNDASDQSSIALLGLAAYYQTRPNETTADVMTKIADGVAAYRLGNHYAYPFGMHPEAASAPGYWHDWGAHMVHALAVAGMTLKNQDWIASAAKDADSFMLRQLAFERFRDMGVVPDRLGQIAYGTNMLVEGYMSLYRATGDEKYAKYAGLAASWLFGNNMAGVQMYDPATGRVFDGINGPVSWRVNRNAGAESTIEGLMSIQAVADEPLANQYLKAQAVSSTPWQLLEAERGDRIAGDPLYYTGTWTGESNISDGRYVGLAKGDVMALTTEITQPGDYLVYVAHMHLSSKQAADVARAIRTSTPPTIDGSLDEWASIPALKSNTRAQFLRGVGAWQGPETDSHAIQLQWDADHLYIAASVRDPEHVQGYTLSNVWHDDALWFYMSTGPDAQRISSKFTFAQTTDGPQIWNWTGSGFVKGATMMWQAQEGGYVYEAAIPWKSLGIEPVAGKPIGLEVGRGIGGNSFMDLTGRDPDVVSNLLPVLLSDPSAADQAASGDDDPVLLRVQIDQDAPTVIEQSVSPDDDYWWLDLAWKSPVFLSKGTHTITYAFAGAGGGRSKLDAFYLQPAVAKRTFKLADNRMITLTYNTLSGESSWTEE